MLRGEHGRTLDLGCATASAFPMLRDREFEVIGIDLSSRMIAFAKQRYADDRGIQLSRGDAEFLPFAAASFDAVTCLGVFEFLPDYAAALREIARILRPGGLLVLSIPNRISPYHITHDVAQATVWRAWRVMKPMLRRGPSATAFTPAARRHLCIPWRLRAELARCGLAPERDAYTNFLVYPLDWLWPRANQALSQLLTRMSVVRIVACTGVSTWWRREGHDGFCRRRQLERDCLLARSDAGGRRVPGDPSVLRTAEPDAEHTPHDRERYGQRD